MLLKSLIFMTKNLYLSSWKINIEISMIKIFELSMRDPLTAQIQCFLEQYPEWSVGKIDYFSYTQARVHFIKSQGHDCNL